MPSEQEKSVLWVVGEVGQVTLGTSWRLGLELQVLPSVKIDVCFLSYASKVTCITDFMKVTIFGSITQFLSSLFFSKHLAKITRFCWLKQGAKSPQTVAPDLGSPLTWLSHHHHPLLFLSVQVSKHARDLQLI